MASVSKIDEDLYSRQLFVMGHAAQARMAQSDILIVGLRGAGVEIAKNIILMGVKSVSLWDPQPAAPADLSANFYLEETDIGQPRAARCLDQLRALNQYVAVNLVEGATVTDEVAGRFHVIVACDQPLAEQLRLNGITRAHGTRFVAAESFGVFARIFCDFGATFRVDDVNGENPASCMVSSLSNEAPGLVTTHEDTRHGLEDGDFVTFAEVQGMTELNGSAPRPIKVKGPFTFTIEDTTGYSAYIRGGWVYQVKMPKDVTFKPMAAMLGAVDGINGPTFDDIVFTDLAKFDVVSVLHAAFGELHALAAATGSLPEAEDSGACERALASIGGVLGRELSDREKTYVIQLWRTAKGHVGPVCASIGGIAAQEVLKAVSGKFMPVRQWLYFDAIEALPFEADKPLPGGECTPTGSRYDGQVAVFGKSFQAALGNLRYFLVGAGAIGCEVLKNWAMMGVGAGPEGSVTVTDMDRIEKSNLSRQFLFRADDIGKAKSTTGAVAAKRMNPALNAIAYETRVGGDTESLFNDSFWDGLSGVCTALDNVDARLYTDSRCVYYGKPLLESGTLGTKGNTQVVVPRLTENYGATRDPPEKSIPVCTLKNFPFKIEHTLQWARDWFEGELKQIPDAVNAYATQESFLDALAKQANTRIDTLEKILDALVTSRPTTVEDCVKWARLKFDDLFINTIKQLLFNFPGDSKSTDGEPFWSGTKRKPSPLVFDPSDPTHLGFVTSATRLRCALYNIPFGPQHTHEYIQSLAASVAAPVFEPRSGVKIAANEKELEEQKKTVATDSATWDVDERAKSIVARLPPVKSLAGFVMAGQEFEKDDDLHISFVTCCSNLRARNYTIEEADKHTSKGIAGKIIPAIATTTALVSGLVCLELYKLLADKPIESYKCCFANLALPLFTMGEPAAVKKNVMLLAPGTTFSPPPLPGSKEASAAVARADGSGVREWHWSVWDRLDIEGPMSLKDFIDFFKTGLGVDIQMVTYAAAILFAFYLPPPKKRERLPQTMAVLAENISKRPISPHARFITLEITGTGPDGKDFELPTIRYRLGGPELKDSSAGAGAGATAS